MKNVVLSAMIVAALAGTASAQAVRLELRLVRQSGALPAAITDIDNNASVITTPGTSLRFEVQYRIIDLFPSTGADDGIYPAGLSALQFDIRSDTDGRFEKARISRNENTAGDLPPTSSDASGNPVPAPQAGRRGLHSPFRGGMQTSNVNEYQANGTFLNGNGVAVLDIDSGVAGLQAGNNSTQGDAIQDIVPLSISQNNQGSEFAVSGNQLGQWYGLYSFDFIAGSSNTFVRALIDADSVTGNSFGFFNDGAAVPVTSGNSVNAAYQVIIPAPGTVALLGLGGLLVARRRRA